MDIVCSGISEDVRAAAFCAAALGSPVVFITWGIRVGARSRADGCSAEVCHRTAANESIILAVANESVVLPCGESGMTLRCMLATAGAFLAERGEGAPITLRRSGSLTKRPLSPLDEQLALHGMEIRESGSDLICSGRLRAGRYELPGNVSSQFVSALLMALPLLDGDSELMVKGRLGSAPYAFMTEDALRSAGIKLERQGSAESGLSYLIPGGQRPRLPRTVTAEGDWSAAAVFLCAGVFSEKGIEVTGIAPGSAQGDSGILDILRRFGAEAELTEHGALVRKGTELRGIELDASYVPDLVPPICALAAAAQGETVIRGAARLRLKESDRLKSCAELLRAIGAEAEIFDDGLRIRGGRPLRGAAVQSFDDHRIAMAAAACSCACEGVMTIESEDCVSKSYPGFWEDWESLARE